ncbi:MAG: DUF2007 domain-containing protein [Clostridia bacterium]|nr:DUF2007 domain-containing protein [Clostridia bacterium]
MYCAKCQRIIPIRSCPECGSLRVREAAADDVCYLTEQIQIWAEMLEDVLRQNGIPFMVRRTLGAGLSMSVGAMLECHRIFVPFAELDRALSIVAELFPGDEGEEWRYVDEEEAEAAQEEGAGEPEAEI